MIVVHCGVLYALDVPERVAPKEHFIGSRCQ